MVLIRSSMKQAAHSFSQRRHFRALEVHPSIQCHEQLNRLKLRIIRRERRAALDELVRQIFNCVAQLLQCFSCLRSDLPPRFPCELSRYCRVCHRRYIESCCRKSRHAHHPRLFLRQCGRSCEVTNVPIPAFELSNLISGIEVTRITRHPSRFLA
jgi:hypothetical protein